MNQAAMKKSHAVQLEAPRIESAKALRIAGLRERYTSETMKNIPALWLRFGPHIGKIPGQVGRVAYGLCFNALSPDGIDYLAGVQPFWSSRRIQRCKHPGAEIRHFSPPRTCFQTR
jgi:hypothetical protein